MFAEQVSQLFTVPQPPPQYGQMLNDFRLIETAALLRFKQVNPERLRYLLYDYQLAEMPVQQFVGSITRSE